MRITEKTTFGGILRSWKRKKALHEAKEAELDRIQKELEGEYRFPHPMWAILKPLAAAMCKTMPG